jgi:hypothetical protein
MPLDLPKIQITQVSIQQLHVTKSFKIYAQGSIYDFAICCVNEIYY